MTQCPAPICLGCVHFHHGSDRDYTCAAYPDGIPRCILESRVDHRHVFIGDRGIRFAPIDQEAIDHAGRRFDV
jgi:hypothetical protein